VCIDKSGANSLLAVDRGASLDVPKLNACLVRELLDRLCEGQVIDPLHEVDDIATFTAAEAVPHASTGGYVKTRGSLVVEGTQPLKASTASRLQGDVFADHIVDPGTLANEGHVVVSNAPSHALILGSAHLSRISARDVGAMQER